MTGAEKTAEIATRIANALRDTVQTAGDQVEELLPSIQEAQQKWSKSFGESFTAFGKEHRTMLISGFVGIVAIGSTTYLVKKRTLHKLSDWIKTNPYKTASLVGGTAILTTAGLSAADYLGYVDLQEAKNTAFSKATDAWQGIKDAHSWATESYQKEVVSAWQMIKGSVKTNTAIVCGVAALGFVGYMFF